MFKEDYRSIREAVEDWFVPEYSPTATSNACVAHQVSCLKLCGLPYPKLGSMQSINVDYFVEWALEQGWQKITHRASLAPGDICVPGRLATPRNLTTFIALSRFLPSRLVMQLFLIINTLASIHVLSTV